ncbi:putative tRNA(His) guanylyltransferase [Pseudolycoriella hygida]|uniref:Probable tRNA(His) guanylyltransferase n=1 Tax=Pseudolycoriella hygida TaxID=35572 RepID=A0A9Q0S077_9DIPT|nr:putative tRNA(His) guanylyltransferase [Pseudolycoriella hygida]
MHNRLFIIKSRLSVCKTLCHSLQLKQKSIDVIRRNLRTSSKMANSKFDYVRSFETDDKILPNVWIVVRIDGKAFHKFSKEHQFDKPNDDRGLNLMSHAAMSVMEEFCDIVLSYGQSDEYSFVFHKTTNLYNRRSAKIMSNVCSLFTASFCFNWSKWFQSDELKYPPSFDGRVVLYPSDQNLKDYLSWRQADVHINNLYNTAFWNLVLKGGMTNAQAEAALRGTVSGEKNELLFSKFGINYNNLPAMYRKGTILLRKKVKTSEMKNRRQLIVPLHVDMIKEKFWTEHNEILDKKPSQNYEFEKTVEELIPKLVQLQIEK